MSIRRCVLLAAALAAAGCTPNKPVIKGTVTLDGKPLNNGSVMLEGDGGRTFGEVVNGDIQFPPAKHDLKPGTYRVQIYSPQRTGKWVQDEGGASVMETTELVPARYNQKSDLTADIKKGENVLTYDLKGK